MGIALTLKNTRMAFPEIFEPKSVNNGEPRYSASFILEPNHPDLPVIEKAIEDVANAQWGKQAGKILEQLKSKDKLCLRDGDDKADYTGFAGNMYVSAARKEQDGRPGIRRRDGKTDIIPQDGLIYPGVRVYARLEIWAQDNQYGKRINATLRSVQFYEHDTAFGGAAPVGDEDFEDLSDMGDDLDNFDDEDDIV